ncbi:MAG: hypothetical protein AB7E47_15345 [Desulfovibrionaceae bacterium]
MGKAVFAALCATLLAATLAHGHGVSFGVIPNRAVAVRFTYAGGEPMSYVEAKVFGPDSTPDLEFQNGRTDAHGVVSFVPDMPGTWTVTAWDEAGHKGTIDVPVDHTEAGFAAGAQAAAQQGPAIIKVVFGLSVLANLALAALLLRHRRQDAA